MAFSRILTLTADRPAFEWAYHDSPNPQWPAVRIVGWRRPRSGLIGNPSPLVRQLRSFIEDGGDGVAASLMLGLPTGSALPPPGAWSWRIVAEDGARLASGTFTLTAEAYQGGGRDWRRLSAQTIELPRSTEDTLDISGYVFRVYPDPPTAATFDVWCEVQSRESGLSLYALADSAPSRQITVHTHYDARIEAGMAAELDGVSYRILSAASVVPYRRLELQMRGAVA